MENKRKLRRLQQINMKVDFQLWQKFKVQAIREDVTLQDLLETTIEEYLKKHRIRDEDVE